ncbi:thioredoxin family protein [Pricia sp. S334]|uniref:Thioredoxin family protein n=1 Tax=Pricia mediterranea TaxID=3076079 RepID=A0ABU3L4D0_9FLAO|nr:thioredoxin family protein [Pricia sp. S334]MDT7828532.1 thioredoxin family protein [Pricia sp. S334]
MQTTEKTTESLIEEALSKALSYADYRKLVAQLTAEGGSTGPEQTDDLANYTLMNDRRMRRFDKTVKVDADIRAEIASVSRQITLLVLTESWCGDAAPSLPVMNKVADLNDNISFKVLLRDENTGLMNRFLTNGAMSIPKLIFLDAGATRPEDKYIPFAVWGPRPLPAAQLVLDHKERHGEILPELKEELQQWYNKDKGQTILREITALLPKP